VARLEAFDAVPVLKSFRLITQVTVTIGSGGPPYSTLSHEKERYHTCKQRNVLNGFILPGRFMRSAASKPVCHITG
jgi:hypothetical protein